MIQRIQSVYLLIAGALCASTLFLPLLFLSTSDNSLYDLYATGLREVGGGEIKSANYLLIIALATTILPFISIFLFKKRMFQLRMCGVEIVLILGYYAMLGAYYYLSYRFFAVSIVIEKGFHPALFAPAIALILAALAAKSIFQDEILVRSVDRIR